MYSDISKALLTHLSEMAGVIDIAGENLNFIPIGSTPYLAVSILYTESNPATLGPNGFDRYPGIFQILVKYPKDLGTESTNIIMSKLKDHFSRGLCLTSNGFSTNIIKVWSNPPIIDETWYVVPFSISFYSDTPNS